MRKPLLSGDVYLFVGKTRTRAKALYFDGTGLCLFSKRLEKGRFAAPREAGEGPLRWTMSELALFLEDSDAVGRLPLSPPVFRPGERALRFG
jgi:transposase